MVIILIAEFIAALNTDRARASIKSLIGSGPQVALLRTGSAERTVPIGELKIGDVVRVHPARKYRSLAASLVAKVRGMRPRLPLRACRRTRP